MAKNGSGAAVSGDGNDATAMTPGGRRWQCSGIDGGVAAALGDGGGVAMLMVGGAAALEDGNGMAAISTEDGSSAAVLMAEDTGGFSAPM